MGDDVDDVASLVEIGIETDRGPWAQTLIAAGYTVYAVNPLLAARYRERLALGGTRATPLTRTCWPTSCAPTPSNLRPGRG